MMDTTRLAELAERLVGPGPKASGVSASECHEIHEDVMELITEHRRMGRALVELLNYWAEPFSDVSDPRLAASGGHETQLVPMFTRVGTHSRAERIALIRRVFEVSVHAIPEIKTA